MGDNMNIHSKELLKFLKEKKVVTSSEVAKFLKISWNTADKYLLELAFENKIERIKKQGVNLWILK
jgi:Mn-dependent DtxR family transcriptional regulator